MTYKHTTVAGADTHTYAYNGLGQRLSQDVNGTLTQYLLDVQPGLYNILASTTGPDTTRFVRHGNRSLRQQQPAGQWQHLLTDGLGSVRSVLDANHLPLETIHYTPYGAGSPTESLHGFTGEPTDANGLVHLRARYYDPALGVFPSLDPLEGNPSQPLSLGRYAYVQGNPINAVDPSGLIMESSERWNRCQSGSENTCPPDWRYVRDMNNRFRERCGMDCCVSSNGWVVESPEEAWRLYEESQRERSTENIFTEGLSALNDIFNAGVAGISCLGKSKFRDNLGSVLTEMISPNQETIKTRGLSIIGFEVSTPFAPVTGGGAISFMFENASWNDVSQWYRGNGLDSRSSCRAFSSLEVGPSLPILQFQPSVPALTWSTADLGQLEGGGINLSGDAPSIGIAGLNWLRIPIAALLFDVAEDLFPAVGILPGVLVGIFLTGNSAGLSVSADDQCNVTAYWVPLADSAITTTLTAGYTWDSTDFVADEILAIESCN